MTDQTPLKSELLRLNKYLALCLAISRREADNLIDRGAVAINGKIATLGARFSTNDKITVDNKPLPKKAEYEYIALYKPTGYVCSRKQQGDNPTIYQLLPSKLHHLKPVGRLDCNSSGLILLTNDGDFAYRMTHPKFYKTKIYQVELDDELAPLHQQMISDFGINLEDGSSKLQLEKINEMDRKKWIVTMHEGRNRQIRRTFSALGYTVRKLHRTDFGSYNIGDLQSGKFEVVKNA